MKIVINTRHSGFCLSDKAILRYLELKGLKVEVKTVNSGWITNTYYLVDQGVNFYDRDIPRNDPMLVQVVEEMGENSGGTFANLKIVEIPDDVKWQIDEYDGLEWVAEVHRTWS